MGLGTMEIVLIAAVIVLLFGAKKLPELARSLGDSAKELRKGLNDDPTPTKVATQKADTAE
ncbi:twin-arginine translocase TatA/TatE family subunit [bacterium]|nr:MAG: twin-arginine translocase TatA/TatE family subunit [bacterium]